MDRSPHDGSAFSRQIGCRRRGSEHTAAQLTEAATPDRTDFLATISPWRRKSNFQDVKIAVVGNNAKRRAEFLGTIWLTLGRAVARYLPQRFPASASTPNWPRPICAVPAASDRSIGSGRPGPARRGSAGAGDGSSEGYVLQWSVREPGGPEVVRGEGVRVNKRSALVCQCASHFLQFVLTSRENSPCPN